MSGRFPEKGGWMLLLLLGSTAAGESLSAAAREVPRRPARARYTDASLPVEDRVEDLLGRMTLAEKLGQMTQGEQQTVSLARARELLLGGMRSGGDSAPAPNNVESWASAQEA